MRMDINCDMGESFGAYKLGSDEEIIKLVTSVNIACGWHAGDAMTMDRTVRLAASHGVGIGAHPGYPDLPGFGRRQMDCTPEEIGNYVIYQIGALSAFCRAHGARLTHVKPHGALYLKAAEDEAIARAVVKAILCVDPSLQYVALAGAKGEMSGAVCRELGIKICYEAFPDRAYTPQGTLLSRRQPGALVTSPQEVAKRALLMAQKGKVIAIDGTEIELAPDTLCIHGDSPEAPALARAIRRRLEEAGVELRPLAAGS